MGSEEDDRFRERVVLAIRGRSTGGTSPRYRAIAMEADIRVADAIAYTQGSYPGVSVAVFSTDNGGVADEELLATVDEALQDPAVRMVNDTITVVSAVTAVQPVTARVWLLPSAPVSLLSDLPGILQAAWSAKTA